MTITVKCKVSDCQQYFTERCGGCDVCLGDVGGRGNEDVETVLSAILQYVPDGYTKKRIREAFDRIVEAEKNR